MFFKITVFKNLHPILTELVRGWWRFFIFARLLFWRETTLQTLLHWAVSCHSVWIYRRNKITSADLNRSRAFGIVACNPVARSQASTTVELDSSIFWVVTRRKVVWNRRFGTTYLSLLKGSLKMGPIGSLETSVSNHLTPCNNPEDRRFLVTVNRDIEAGRRSVILISLH
jgi:hypothetical protein